MLAMYMVEATVVAPLPFSASTSGKSRRLVLRHLWPSSASFLRLASSSPTRITPSRMAMVAGTAPLARATCSTSRAVW